MSGSSDPKHINDTMNSSIADKAPVPTTEQVIEKLQLNTQLAYIEADAFIADPYSLLGQVCSIRKRDGKCPTSLADGNFSAEFTVVPVTRKVNENSKLVKPVMRESIVVDQKLSASVDFLSYLSASMDAESFYSVIVFDQASGLIDTQDSEWSKNVQTWIANNQQDMNDADVCYLFVITGFIQKNIVKRKYKKFDGKVKGGAYGLNVNGELATSTEDNSLDIKFGLTPAIIKRPSTATAPASEDTARMLADGHGLFATLTGARIEVAGNKKTLVM